MGCLEALEQPPPQKPDKKIILVAAAALFDRDGKVLIAQRPEGKSMAGLWEFPGGKVEQGETPEYALMRELREELNIETRPCCFSSIAFASHEYNDFHLLMPLFICRVWEGIVTPQEGQNIKWVMPSELNNYPMPEADIPLITALRHV